MYIIYQIFYVIYVLFYMLVFLFKGRKRQGIAMRFGAYPQEIENALSTKRNIWLHAVSVGEVMAAKPLADRIKKDLSQYTIVISTVTETGNALAKKIMPKDSSVIYLPLDFSFAVGRVLRLVNPAAFIIMETEIWPNLIRALHKNGVPIILSNGRISQKSYKWYRLTKPLLKNILNCMTGFFMGTEEDAGRIISLGADRQKVIVAGNIKFDSAGFDIDKARKESVIELLGLKDNKLIVAGSTHPGEEEILLDVYKNLKHKHNDISLLIAPRHIERAGEIAETIKCYGFTPVKMFGLTHKPAAANPVFILDAIGELKLFYSIAWVVFTGGSLVKHGGQNMIEPAFFGKPVIFGPHVFNFKDVACALMDKKAAITVKDKNSLLEAIEKLYKDRAFYEETGKNAKDTVLANQGSAAKTIEQLKLLLQY